MAGRKLSAKTEEEVGFLEQVLGELDHLVRATEEYATYKGKNDGDLVMAIIRQLAQIRQNGMVKNLGPIADQAGILSVAANRGSRNQRVRVLREGLGSYKQAIERTIKAMIDADQRHAAEEAAEHERMKAAEHAAAQRMAERALREAEEAKAKAAAAAPSPASPAPQAAGPSPTTPLSPTIPPKAQP
jgi:capsule polysaccharide export protein KpsE/RkpR